MAATEVAAELQPMPRPSGRGQQVERSIRTAIASAWMKGSPERWRTYFPTAPDGTIPRPTNGDFIARLATLLVAEDGRR